MAGFRDLRSRKLVAIIMTTTALALLLGVHDALALDYVTARDEEIANPTPSPT